MGRPPSGGMVLNGTSKQPARSCMANSQSDRQSIILTVSLSVSQSGIQSASQSGTQAAPQAQHQWQLLPLSALPLLLCCEFQLLCKARVVLCPALDKRWSEEASCPDYERELSMLLHHCCTQFVAAHLLQEQPGIAISVALPCRIAGGLYGQGT